MDETIILSAKGLDLWYGPTQALKGVSMDIPEKQVTALIGPSGCGKSTFLKTLDRMNDLVPGIKITGSVQYRGQEIYAPNVDVTWLRKQIGMVFQKPNPFPMSIYDNVRMGKKDATREEVMEALKNAQCEDIIEKLPNGIDTVIGSKGTYLSGGEAQRISIARAMLKNAPILILDEATAFADPDNEVKVQAAFAKLSKGKTVIMIAHRLSSVTGVDRIFVLQDGEIRQAGKHEELKDAEGLYAHMWKEYNQSVSWKVGV